MIIIGRLQQYCFFFLCHRSLPFHIVWLQCQSESDSIWADVNIAHTQRQKRKKLILGTAMKPNWRHKWKWRMNEWIEELKFHRELQISDICKKIPLYKQLYFNATNIWSILLNSEIYLFRITVDTQYLFLTKSNLSSDT